MFLNLRILAGTPATIALSGISLVTTELAPTVTLLPMRMFPITLAPANIVTLSPRIGTPAFFPS